MLASTEISIVTPALRALGNVVTGSDVQTASVIESGGLPVICSLLSHAKSNVIKEAAWTISNITAGPQEQIQAVLDNNCLPPLIEVLAHGDFKSKKESAWAITNLTSGNNDQLFLRAHLVLHTLHHSTAHTTLWFLQLQLTFRSMTNYAYLLI